MLNDKDTEIKKDQVAEIKRLQVVFELVFLKFLLSLHPPLRHGIVQGFRSCQGNRRGSVVPAWRAGWGS